MATSGSINYSATAHSIITEALEQVGVLGENESPNQDQIDSCLRTLNYMVKSWQTRKAHLFTLQKLFLFTEKDTTDYILNSSSSANITNSYVQTSLSAAASSGATSITVESITGISDGDYIGVEVSNNNVHWTIVSGTPTGSTVSLTNGLSASASSGGAVYAYTTKANRPMKIYNIVVHTKDGTDTPIEKLEYERFQNLSNKNADGRINQVYYDPQVATPTLSVWPQSDDETDVLVLWTVRSLDDFDATTNEVDFPQEWFAALAFNLAVFICPKFGVSDATYQKVAGLASMLLEDAETWDSEDSFNIEPDKRHS